MTQLTVYGPLYETNVHDDLRTHPMRAHARQADCSCKGRFGKFKLVQPRTQIEQQLRVETSADFARKDEIVAFVLTDEQCAEPDALALRIGEPADDEVLRQFTLHLQPVSRASMFVLGITPLRDHAFPAFSLRALPR